MLAALIARRFSLDLVVKSKFSKFRSSPCRQHSPMEISDKLTRLLSSKKKRKVFNTSGEGGSAKLDQYLATSCRQFFNQKVDFHCVDTLDSHLDHLKARYKPLNRTIPHSSSKAGMDVDTAPTSPGSSSGAQNELGKSLSHTDEIPRPKREIFDSKNLTLEWKSARGIGAGLSNLGNTCFLNSVLQCLVYTPPLYNYLTSLEHKQKCERNVFVKCFVFF